METQKSEGIVLKTIPYKDFDQIITAFTPDRGILKIFLKKTSGKGRFAPTLSRVEFVYKKGQSDLQLCTEVSLIEQYPGLREEMPRLEVACELIQMIYTTQFPDKPAPLLYQLLLRCLHAISESENPYLIGASFQLKLLRHEGHFGITDNCSVCHTPLLDRHFLQGEFFCDHHQPPGSIPLSADEYHQVLVFAFCQKFSDLNLCDLTLELKSKIKSLYESTFSLA